MMVADLPTLNNRYRLLEPLGEGGMGVVYRALDRLTGETVALKRVAVSLGQLSFTSHSEQDPALALAQEFQVLASLRHPNIIAVRDYGFDVERRPFFTMDLMEHPRTIIQAGQGQPREMQVHLLQQMLLALVYLHRRGIVHRDLKPGNVLVTGDRVQVLDFGLSVTVEQAPAQRSGSLAYMAPEVLCGEPASPAADLYAVGVIACELFAGRHPYDTQDVSGLIDQILETPASKLLAGMDGPVVAILERLLAKSPQERFADAGGVIRALSEATGQELPSETKETRESFLRAAKFVGRQAELTNLTQALSQAMAGDGSAWLVGGESGVGKSRLVDELRARALVQGVLTLRGQAVSEGSRPYHLWREAVRWLALLADPDDLQAGVLKPLATDLAELLGREVQDTPELEPKAAQTRLFTVIGELMRRGAAAQPLAILLEDLQWADANSLELLAWLSRLAAGLPLIVIGTYRDDESPDLPARLPELRALALRRLELENVAALSESMLGAAGLQPHIIHFLHQETEGNVFFVVEVVRALAEEAGRLDDIARMTLPVRIFAGGMQQVVQRRLSRLPPADYPLLQFAAVAGREMDREVLRAADETADVERWLTTCANAAILDVHENRWRFAHDKLREGVLAELSAEQWQTLHRRAGEALERVFAADRSTRYADLAYHFGQANVLDRERHYARLAGEQAAVQFANTQALAFLSRALELTEEDDPAARYELVLAREKIYYLQGNRPAETQDLDRLSVLAEALNDDRRRAQAALRRARHAEATGDFVAVVAAAQQAIALAQSVGDIAIQAETRALWGETLRHQTEYTLAHAQLEQALVLAREARLPALEAESLLNLGGVWGDQAKFVEARVCHEQALRICQEIGNRQLEGVAFNNLGFVSGMVGDPLGARNSYEQALRLTRETGDRRIEGLVLNNLASIANFLGDLARGQAYQEQSLRLAREIGDRAYECLALLNLASLANWSSNFEQARELGQQAVAIAREVRTRQFACYALTLLGHTWLGLGSFAQADDAYHQALTLGREVDKSNLTPDPLTGLARLKLAEGNPAQALVAVEEILGYMETHTIDDSDDPFLVRLTCYQVLQANDDPRAQSVLSVAWNLLQQHADKIGDEAARQMFLRKLRDEMRRVVASLLEAPPPANGTTLPPEPPARVVVQNGTVTAGLAGQTAEALKVRGFYVVQYGNTDDNRSDYAQTEILVYTGRMVVAQAIADALKVPASAVRPMTGSSDNVDIKVILGADYRVIGITAPAPLAATPVIAPSSTITR